MKRWLLCLLLFAVLPFAAVAAQGDECPAMEALQFEKGDLVQITADEIYLYAEPSTSSIQVAPVSAGTVFIIWDEARCADGYRWWRVSFNGNTMWVMEAVGDEYALAKVEGEVSAEPPVDDTNTSFEVFDLTNQIEQWGYGEFIGTAWSADGQTLGVAATGGILLYNTENMEAEPTVLSSPDSVYFSFDFHPTDAHLLAVTDYSGGIWLGDITTPQLSLFHRVESAVNGVKFSADGTRILAYTDQWLYVWDVTSGERIHAVYISSNLPISPASIVISEDGSKVASSEYGLPLRIWDISGTEPILTERAQPDLADDLRLLTFSGDNRVIYGFNDTGLYAWSWENDEKAVYEQAYFYTNSDIIVDGNHLLTFDLQSDESNTLVNLWSPEAMTEPVQSFTIDEDDWLSGLSLSPDKSRLAAIRMMEDGYRGLVVYDFETFEPLYSTAFPLVSSLFASPVSLASNDFTGTVVLRDLNSGEVINTVSGDFRTIFRMGFSDDGQQLALCASEITPEWNTINVIYSVDLTETKEASILDSNLSYSCSWLIHDGENFITEVSPPIRGIMIGEDAPVYQYPDDVFTHGYAAFMIEDALWLMNVETGMHKVDLETGAMENVLSEMPASFIAADTEGKFFAGIHENQVSIFDIAAGEVISTFVLANNVQTVAFSPDSSTIMTGDTEGTILELDTRSGEELRRIGRAPGAVTSIVFSPDGNRLYTTGNDHIGRVWSIK